MSELTALFEDGSVLGTIFFGGVVGNFADLSVRDGGQSEGEPLLGKISVMAQGLVQGGHDGNYDLLRLLLRAECRVIMALCDRILLDDFGFRIGRGSLRYRLGKLLNDRADEEAARLCRLRHAFEQSYEEFKSIVLEDLVPRQTVSLPNVSEIIQSGRECLETSGAEPRRKTVVKLQLMTIDHALREQGVMSRANFEDPISPEGLPSKLVGEIEKHPAGWWDFLRLAVREELNESGNERVRKAWEMGVLSHFPQELGTSHEDFEAKQSILDEKISAAWNDLKRYRGAIKNAINDALKPRFGRRPFQLPARAMGGKLIGREELLGQLVQRLRSRGHVVVCGGVGMGKSALAAEAVVALIGDSENNLATSPYPEGVVVLDFSKIQSAANFEPAWFYLADQFGSGWLTGEAIRQDFRRGHALVIVENAEEIDANNLRKFLETLPAGLTALVLTRNRFEFGKEPPISVHEPLDANVSRGLLRIFCQDSAIYEAILSQLCDLLGGHPLSLIWAGCQLAAGSERPGDFIHALKTARLSDSSQANQEQGTIRWLFDHAMSRLSSDDRHVLAAAATFSHYPVTLSAGTVVTRNQSKARESLKRLAAFGMLRPCGVNDEQWEFNHPLAHHFARVSARSTLLVGLGRWAITEFDIVVNRAKEAGGLSSLVALITDISAMLRADSEVSGFDALRHRLLHDGVDKIVELGLKDAASELSLALNDWLRRAVEEWPSDPILASQLSSSYEQIGDIDRDNADSSYQESIKVTERVIEGDENNLVLQRELMRRYDKLGNFYLLKDDHDAARAVFLKALAVAKRLAAPMPGDTKRQIELACSYSKLADLELAASNHDQSRDLTQKAMDIVKTILDKEPSNNACDAILADSYQRLGQLQFKAGDIEAARDQELKALEILERLAADNPAEEGLQVALYWAYFNISQADGRVDDQDAERTHLAQCRVLEERMDASHGLPTTTSLSDSFLADLEVTAGNFAVARALYQKRLEIHENAARKDPTDGIVHRDLSFAYQQIGNVELAAGNLETARLLLQKSLDICERFIVVEPPESLDKSFRLGLRNAYNSLGDVEFAAGNFDSARALIRKGLEINESLAEWNILSQQGLLANRQKLGDAEAAAGNLEVALSVFLDTAALCERLIESDPKTANWKHDLSVTYMKVGDVLERQNQTTEALGYFEKAELISAKLVQTDPAYEVWKNHLAALMDRIARLSEGAT